MQNPFSLKVVTRPEEFCNRTSEIQKLINCAASNTNVVIFSPRRYGKTSLVRHVQNQLAQSGFNTIYIDLFGLSSADNIASRFAKGVYKALYEKKSLWQKALSIIKSHRPVIRPDSSGTGLSITAEVAGTGLSGPELLDETLSELGRFMAAGKKRFNLALDEFQEITEIKDSNIEGILRAHVQHQEAAYFFIGSRRRVLLNMFNQKRRPFFQSAINFELDKLPHNELTAFVMDRFQSAKKRCPEDVADQLANQVADHPYYCQKLAFFCFERSDRKATHNILQQAYDDLIQSETPVYEAILQGLSPRQIALLKAIAKEPSKSLMSIDYMRKHTLKSVGGVQSAIKKLEQLDLIEKKKDGPWIVVDPVFATWL